MSKQFAGRVVNALQVGDIVHITLNDEKLESPELIFDEAIPVAEPVIEPTVGVTEAELPNAETSEHAETT